MHVRPCHAAAALPPAADWRRAAGLRRPRPAPPPPGWCKSWSACSAQWAVCAEALRDAGSSKARYAVGRLRSLRHRVILRRPHSEVVHAR